METPSNPHHPVDYENEYEIYELDVDFKHALQ